MNPQNSNFGSIFNSFVMNSRAYQSKQTSSHTNLMNEKTNFDCHLQLVDTKTEQFSESEALNEAKSESNHVEILEQELQAVSDESSSDSSECSIGYIQTYLADNSYDENSVYQEINFSTQLNEAFDYLYFAVLKEKGKCRKIKFSIDIDRIEFSNQLSGELELYQGDLEVFENIEKMLKDKILCDSLDLIEIELSNNRKLVTSTRTLCRYPSSKLAKTITKSIKLSLNESTSNSYCSNINQGKASTSLSDCKRLLKHVVLRRDPLIFELLISFLRNDTLPYFKDYNQECLFIEEALHWGIPLNNKLRLSKHNIFNKH